MTKRILTIVAAFIVGISVSYIGFSLYYKNLAPAETSSEIDSAQVISSEITAASESQEVSATDEVEEVVEEEKEESIVNKTSSKSSTKVNTTSKTQATADFISKSKAKSIALKHAGVSSSDIYNYTIELDRDYGAISYEIDFDANGTEYSYDIDAKTGSIIKFEKEKDDDYIKPKKKTSSKTSTSSGISKNEAKSIALKAANLKSSQIYAFEINKDYDDGRQIYEIEFKSGNTEYSFEINAKNGKIIDKDIDIDD